MLNLKNSVTGIDIPIQSFERYIYGKLATLWGLNDTTFEGYGRCYKNTNDKGTVPEVFVSGAPGTDNTIYKAIFFDKTIQSALFFFSVDDVAKFDYSQGQEIAKISLIFITNLELVKPKLAHRGDEEVRNDVEGLCSADRYGLTLTGTETGFKNVFKQFTGLINKDGEVFEDRHPLFCFKINFDLYYQPTSKDCGNKN